MIPSMRVVGQDGLHSLNELKELAETEEIEDEGAGAGAVWSFARSVIMIMNSTS